MDLRYFNAFVVVAEELHFGRAAARLYMSSSTLSGHIKTLEREVGVQLLVRSSRHVALTKAGHIFLAEARRALDDADAACEAARHADRDRLRLGWPADGDQRIVHDTYTQFCRTFPDCDIEVTVGYSARLSEAVRDNQLDIAFVHEPHPGDGDVAVRLLARHPLQLVCQSTHPLATQAGISIQDLKGFAHVRFPEHLNPQLYRRLYEHLLPDAPHLSTAPSWESTIAVVAATDAIAIRLFPPLPHGYGTTVITRELALPELCTAVGMVWRRSRPRAEAFAVTATRVAERWVPESSGMSERTS